jgi:uncharacterized membrane protein YccF (DUF307 family)
VGVANILIMRTLGNIIWHFPLFGFVTAFFTFLVGGFFVLTVVGAPIGLGLIQHAKFLLSPFSNRMISDSKIGKNKSTLWTVMSIIAFIIYFPFGLMVTLVTVVQIMILFISIIGIPVAIVLAKSISTYFNPINKICVSVEMAEEIAKREAVKKVDALTK